MKVRASVKKICRDCDKVLGEPSAEELKAFEKNIEMSDSIYNEKEDKDEDA